MYIIILHLRVTELKLSSGAVRMCEGHTKLTYIWDTVVDESTHVRNLDMGPIPLLFRTVSVQQTNALHIQAVARKFNQLQRREASIGGTKSLIDLRQPAAVTKKTAAERRSSRRPRSSGGRMTATPAALPCLAGAALQHKDGGGLLAIRQPPLRAAKGLPSSKQLDEGFARRRANERKLASKANAFNNAGRGVGMGEGAPNAAELDAAAREEFVVKISRRDDILQVNDTAMPTTFLSVVVLPPPLALALLELLRHMHRRGVAAIPEVVCSRKAFAGLERKQVRSGFR